MWPSSVSAPRTIFYQETLSEILYNSEIFENYSFYFPDPILWIVIFHETE